MQVNVLSACMKAPAGLGICYRVLVASRCLEALSILQVL